MLEPMLEPMLEYMLDSMLESNVRNFTSNEYDFSIRTKNEDCWITYEEDSSKETLF